MDLQDPRLFLSGRLDLLPLELVLIPCVGTLALDDGDISLLAHSDPLSDRSHRPAFRECLEGQPIQTSIRQTVAIV